MAPALGNKRSTVGPQADKRVLDLLAMCIEVEECLCFVGRV
jgi:hypothetical protein